MFREHTCFGRLHSILQDIPLPGLLQPRQDRLKIESTIVIVRLRYFVCFSKKILQNLHDWGLASAVKSNAENNKIILNMFLAQALFLNWYENQPPLQSKVKNQIDNKTNLYWFENQPAFTHKKMMKMVSKLSGHNLINRVSRKLAPKSLKSSSSLFQLRNELDMIYSAGSAGQF